MDLLFFGTQKWAATLLECVLDDPFFRVLAAVTQPDRPVGRGHALEAPPVKQTALARGVMVLQPETLTDAGFLTLVNALQPQIVLVIAYGRILPQRLLDIAPLGFINVHPSLLPRWRGPSPIQAAIAAGDEVSGVTIMRLDDKMDHGPILAQVEIRLAPDETPASFEQKVLAVTKRLLLNTLKEYAQGVVALREQQHTRATTCRLLTREDGRMDWNRPAEELERAVRAYQPWPGAWTSVSTGTRESRLKILEATVAPSVSGAARGQLIANANRLFVQTGSGTLELLTIQLEGKPPMSARAFLSGYARSIGNILA
ncbi:methionyl-tRNA formyltransferase [Candidatus Parcubacteria bacterium]|nr:methionyl-tRNA formyltransferase [Candidatus Parcubacteria bacterium]